MALHGARACEPVIKFLCGSVPTRQIGRCAGITWTCSVLQSAVDVTDRGRTAKGQGGQQHPSNVHGSMALARLSNGPCRDCSIQITHMHCSSDVDMYNH
ncbi:hypothetical protein BS78_04G303300 [Paspalum vaginatum]|nr:hypothetical protein BS78_04G303300 [Paspalum vaginatum]